MATAIGEATQPTGRKAVLLQGNEAVAEGAIAAGARFFAGYPITPSTEIEVLPLDAVRDAVLSRVPARFKELNEEAFDFGLRLGDEAVAMLATSRATKTD